MKMVKVKYLATGPNQCEKSKIQVKLSDGKLSDVQVWTRGDERLVSDELAAGLLAIGGFEVIEVPKAAPPAKKKGGA